MPPNPDVLRRELAEQGVDPDGVPGRWLARLLSRGETATSTNGPPPGKPTPLRRRPVENQTKGV